MALIGIAVATGPGLPSIDRLIAPFYAQRAARRDAAVKWQRQALDEISVEMPMLLEPRSDQRARLPADFQQALDFLAR